MKWQFLNFGIVFLVTTTLMGTPPPEADFTVNPGSTYNGNIITDTGDILVFRGARVKGKVQSTSGDIYIENDARVKKIIALNGDVFLDEGVTVDQSIRLTNGSLRVKANSTIKGNVITEFGDIRISGSTLKKNIRTRHGDIILKDNTYVKKDIIILDRGNTNNLEPLEIYLGMGVEVNGDVQADDEDDLVELEMFNADVNGDIDNVSMNDDDEEEDEDDCGGRPTWTASTTYVRNDQVAHEGEAYRARKRTTGYAPTDPGRKNPWRSLGPCDEQEAVEDDDDDD